MVFPNCMWNDGRILIVSLYFSAIEDAGREKRLYDPAESIFHMWGWCAVISLFWSRMTDSIDCLVMLGNDSWGKTWLEYLQLSDIVCLLSLLAHSNRFHCMTYWLETSKVEVTSFGEQLFSELEWMKSLVSASIKFYPSLLLVMPYSPSGMPKALFFRTLDLPVIFQKLPIWCLLMEFRLCGVWLLDYIQTNDPSDAEGKSLKCTSELNHSIVRKEEFTMSLNLIQ